MDSLNPRILFLEDSLDIENEIRQIGCDPRSLPIMSRKSKTIMVKLERLSPVVCNIIKQEMLSLGGEAAIPWNAIAGRGRFCNTIIMGTQKQYESFCKKLKNQPSGLNKISDEIENLISNYFKKFFKIKIGQKEFVFGRRTYVMGILNLTPDSFSGDGIYKEPTKALEAAQRMEEEGADIIDIGGESTRPGSAPISVEEELKRVIPVIKRLAKKIRIPISIDTMKSKVAEEALENGASMVNDISGLRADKRMRNIIKRHNVLIVIMHIKGTPRTMQRNPEYKSLISEIIESLRRSIEDSGIKAENIIIDPGIGFGKTVEHNLEILKRLREFRSLGRPILVGTSRKSFIGKVLNLELQDRLFGTAATVALAIRNGAHIVRVHDVKEMVQVARMTDSICRRN